MNSRVVTFVWLLVIWVMLVGTISLSGVLTGAAVSAGLLWFFRPTRRHTERLAFRPLNTVRFLLYFHVKFIEATIHVARAVIRPDRERYTPAVVAVPIGGASEIATMLLANAVSLTPGTFIVDMRRDPATFYVHVLQFTSVRATRLEILELERRIVRAIGTSEAIANVERLIAAVAAEGAEKGRHG